MRALGDEKSISQRLAQALRDAEELRAFVSRFAAMPLTFYVLGDRGRVDIAVLGALEDIFPF